MDELWHMIEAERLALADLLDRLEPEQWDAPSLCSGWRVRDVAAHVTLSTRARPLTALVGVARARGNFNRYVAADARVRAARPAAELAAELREVAGSRHHPPGTKPEDPLVDVIVHGQDIARGIGLEHPAPTQAAVLAADRVWSMSFPFHARRRCSGVAIRASDVSWERGNPADAEVTGPVLDILLLLTGRLDGLRHLHGSGVDVLAGRLGAR